MHQSSKIIVLGARSVGKTALVLRCLTGQFFPQSSTRTDTAYHFEYEGNIMDIVDSKGKNEALISYADGIVLVYSVTERSSFVHLQTVMHQVRHLNFKQDLKMIIVGTKSDMAKQRAVSLYEGQELAVDNRCFFMETSAYSPKQNIHEIFTQLLVAKFNIRSLALKKKRRTSSCDYDGLTASPPLTPTRRKSSNIFYESVRNLVQKKRRQSTSTEFCRQYYAKPLNRELSKSLAMF